MKRLLLFGYGPFLGHASNPSGALARALDGTRSGAFRIVARLLPVSFRRAPGALHAALRAIRPDAVLGLGLARERQQVGVESLAINLFHSEAPDADGAVVRARRLDPDGPAAYFCSYPVRAVAAAIERRGVPVAVSTSAGTYVCNQCIYELGRHFERAGEAVPWGFLHLPAGLPLAQLEAAVGAALKMLCE